MEGTGDGRKIVTPENNRKMQRATGLSTLTIPLPQTKKRGRNERMRDSKKEGHHEEGNKQKWRDKEAQREEKDTYLSKSSVISLGDMRCSLHSRSLSANSDDTSSKRSREGKRPCSDRNT